MNLVSRFISFKFIPKLQLANKLIDPKANTDVKWFKSLRHFCVHLKSSRNEELNPTQCLNITFVCDCHFIRCQIWTTVFHSDRLTTSLEYPHNFPIRISFHKRDTFVYNIQNSYSQYIQRRTTEKSNPNHAYCRREFMKIISRIKLTIPKGTKPCIHMNTRAQSHTTTTNKKRSIEQFLLGLAFIRLFSIHKRAHIQTENARARAHTIVSFQYDYRTAMPRRTLPCRRPGHAVPLLHCIHGDSSVTS